MTSVTNDSSRKVLANWARKTIDEGGQKELLEEAPLKFADKFIKEVLQQRATTKLTKYEGKTPHPFIPCIVTSGGWIHETWFEWLKSLKPELKMTKIYQLLGRILLKNRAINFRLSY